MIDKNVIETRAVYVKVVQEGIIRVEKKLGVDLDSSDLDELDKVYHRLLKGKQGLILLIFELDCTSDMKFKTKASSKERSTFKKAEAMVIKSLANRIEANFYKNYFTPSHPIKVFNSESDAIAWLLTFN